MAISSRVEERLSTELKRFQPILSAAKNRDVNESDTSAIVHDIIADLFGYDKFSEITRELCIRGTYCDLAARIEGKFRMITEVKAIGLELKDNYARQALDYAAKLGIDWISLTNGHHWKVFKVIFGKPIDAEQILDIDLLALSPKNSDHLENLFLMTKESMLRSGLETYHGQVQVMNKFFLGAVLLSDPVLDSMRRELRRISPEVKVQNEDLQEMLVQDVLKREVIEGDKAEAAKKKVKKAADKLLRTRKEKEEAVESGNAGETQGEQCPPAMETGNENKG